MLLNTSHSSRKRTTSHVIEIARRIPADTKPAVGGAVIAMQTAICPALFPTLQIRASPERNAGRRHVRIRCEENATECCGCMLAQEAMNCRLGAGRLRLAGSDSLTSRDPDPGRVEVPGSHIFGFHPTSTAVLEPTIAYRWA